METIQKTAQETKVQQPKETKEVNQRDKMSASDRMMSAPLYRQEFSLLKR